METGANTGEFRASGTVSAGVTSLYITYNDDAPAKTATVSARVETTTGAISLDADEYSIASKATVTLVEPDLNLNSKAKDTIAYDNPDDDGDGTVEAGEQLWGRVYIYSDVDAVGSGIKLTETGANTGTFVGYFYFSLTATTKGDEPIIKIGPGKGVYALYKDDASTTGADVNLVDSAKFVTHTASLSLNKTTYSAGSLAIVTLVDPDLNASPVKVDSIAYDDPADGMLKDRAYVYSTSDPTGSGILLVETGANTGEFTGTFTFADATTKGDSPKIKVKTGDTVTVLFWDQYNDAGTDQKIKATALYQTTTGSVETDRTAYSYKKDTKMVVYVTDPDANVNPGAADEFGGAGAARYVEIKLTHAGTDYSVKPTMKETGADTSKFKAVVTFTDLKDANGNALAVDVAPGTTITVTYHDTENAAGAAADIRAFVSTTSRTGILTLDKDEYAYKAKVSVTLTEPDLNLNPGAIDSIAKDADPATKDAGYVYAYSTTDMTGISLGLTETGVNTGEFAGSFTLTDTSSSDAGTLKCVKGDTIYVRYVDEKDAAGTQVNITVTTTVTATTGSISLDKSSYPIYGAVKITVTDPDMNLSETIVDTIAATKVTIKTAAMTETTNPSTDLAETGVNTGVFTVAFTLNTQVGGKWVNAGDGSGLSVTYIDEVDATGAKNVARIATAVVEATTASLTFDKATYDLADTATVTLTDPDANKNAKLIESLTITVKSDTDPAGLSLTLTETDTDTGVFTGTMSFSTAATAGTKLRVTAGDTVTAAYKDYTVEGCTVKDGVITSTNIWQTVTATATVGVVIPTLPITAGAPAMTDPTTGEVVTPVAGESVMVSTELENTATVDQDMLYIVQIKDATGKVVYMSYISGTVPAGRAFTFGVQWIPAEAGDYTVEVFAWKSWTEPTPLSESVSQAVTVS